MIGRLAALPLLVFFLSAFDAPESVQGRYGKSIPVPLREGFESGDVNTGALEPCWRKENYFSDVQNNPRMDKYAAAMTVYPRLPMPPSALEARPAPSCIDIDDPSAGYDDDGTERAEIWERVEDRLPFGTEVWYGFSMFIGGEVPPNDGVRLIGGQWKGNGHGSPFVAQRFKNRRFYITIQQDVLNSPDPNQLQECRILLAYQNEPPPMPESENLTTGEPCMADLRIERFDYLPNPFDTWTDMAYRMKLSLKNDGVVEVWAGGKLIARARGRIGEKANASVQYFKFGPYRDGYKAHYSTTMVLDAFARGRRYEDVVLGGPRAFVGGASEGAQPPK